MRHHTDERASPLATLFHFLLVVALIVALGYALYKAPKWIEERKHHETQLQP